MAAHRSTWHTHRDKNTAEVHDVFANLAPNYDALNQWISLRTHKRLRALAVRKLSLTPGASALDVCSGTGDFISALRTAVGPKGRVIGVDFCLPMIREANRKHVPGLSLLADAGALPIASNSVDAVTVGWGIRNVGDLEAVHQEIFRVLKPGGRFVSLDMTRPDRALGRASARALHYALPKFGGIVGHGSAYAYLSASTLAFASKHQLAESMRRAGFAQVGFSEHLLGNVCMHSGAKP